MSLADLFHVTEPGALEGVDPCVLDAFLSREGGAHLVGRGRIGSVGTDAAWLRRVIVGASGDFPVRLADALAHVEDLTERLVGCGAPSALERAMRMWMRDASRVRSLLSEPVRMYRRAPRRRVRIATSGSSSWGSAAQAPAVRV